MNTLNEVIQVPVDATTKAAITELAKNEHRRVGQMGRVLFQEALEHRGIAPTSANDGSGDTEGDRDGTKEADRSTPKPKPVNA